ncbi:MAG: hypothetical protein K6B46_01900 [Opitutales bacterium]|nr:hypothetical protein [Opitutales bacterium]
MNLLVDFLENYKKEFSVFVKLGNAILVRTATGVWQITYNGENRPVRFENIVAGTILVNRGRINHTKKSNAASTPLCLCVSVFNFVPALSFPRHTKTAAAFRQSPFPQKSRFFICGSCT